jgi:CopZ-like zinc binding protein
MVEDTCCCPPEAGNASCELPMLNTQNAPRVPRACPVCGRPGKSVDGQTVKALLSVSLRQVGNGSYFFCRTQDCPVVYFSADGAHRFTVDQIREPVYQKQPDAGDVFVCYCFRHTVSNIRDASPEDRIAIVDNINAGIDAGQCACDLRNPQGSCCLGNARSLIRKLEQTASMEQ